MHSSQRIALAASGAALFVSPLFAQGSEVRVAVTIENVAADAGTFQTPVWVGFHDGTFDSYDGGTPASSLPIPGSVAIERIAEDGNTGPISDDFDLLGVGADQATIAGPQGPIAPGDIARREFLLDSLDPRARYFSYASMIIPSNDAFVANGSPVAHPMFDPAGVFIGQSFFVRGSESNDAGTEVNDEVPANTAFFGQMAPNTGVDEGGLITAHPGFLSPGSGGILDDFRFSDADFVEEGFSLMRFRFRASEAVTDERLYVTLATGFQEVPVTTSPAVGIGVFRLAEGGTKLDFTVNVFGLQNFSAAHLHLAPAGANGPVVVDLAENGQTSVDPISGVLAITGTVTSAALVGPTTGFPLDELVNEVDGVNVYLNVHTNDGLPGDNTGPGDFASGEVRGQLVRIL